MFAFFFFFSGFKVVESLTNQKTRMARFSQLQRAPLNAFSRNISWHTNYTVFLAFAWDAAVAAMQTSCTLFPSFLFFFFAGIVVKFGKWLVSICIRCQNLSRSLLSVISLQRFLQFHEYFFKVYAVSGTRTRLNQK